MLAMFGYESEEFARLTADDLHPPEVAARVAADFGRMRDGFFEPFRGLPCRRSDGSQFVCDIQPGVVEIDGSVRFVAFFTDVTEVHELTARLIESQQLAQLGSWQLDHTTGHLDWSTEVFRIFGIDPGEFAATYEAFLAVTHPDDVEMVDEVYTRSLRDGSPYDLAHRVLRLDGSVVWVHERAVHEYDDEGRPLRSNGSVQDITQQRLADERSRTVAALESLGRITGELAHDVGNLLHVITASVETGADLVQSELSADRAQPVLDTLALAIEACRRGGELTSRLLAVARRQPLSPVEIDLAEEVSSLRPFAETVLGRSARFEIVTPDEPVVVRIDVNAFTAALLNLLTNARDALLDVGSVRLEVTRTGCPEHLEVLTDACARVSVIDDGIGIPDQHLARVFEPFWTSKPSGRGTGLGLAMVHGFATQSGGTATIDSRPGRGTTVSIWLPTA